MNTKKTFKNTLPMISSSTFRISICYHQRKILPIRLITTIPEKNEVLQIKKGVSKLFDDGLKYRFHPGIRKNPCKELPLKLYLSALSIINRYRSKKFREDVDRIRKESYEVFIEKDNKNSQISKNKRFISFDSDFNILQSNSDNEIRDIRKKFYFSEPYTHFECAAYMASRLPANYSAIKYIFNEICYEEPNFRPKSLFDFGSGVGSTIWAADETWKGSLNEVFCVDLNENMNDISRELLQKGTTYCENILDKMFYRQFLPVKHRPGYDLVVSGFSLLDFPDTRSRIHLVENLWKKTNGMLVLVEHGSKAGFLAIMEARNFLLQISKRQLDSLKSSGSGNDLNVSKDIIYTEGSIVAPCPHEQICPRQLITDKKSYCNFISTYHTLNIGQIGPGTRDEKFAYLIMKKNDHQSWTEMQKSWPRCVEATIPKSKHTQCKLCTNSGKLQKFILSKKITENHIYQTARRSTWGDKIPADVVLKPVNDKKSDELD